MPAPKPIAAPVPAIRPWMLGGSAHVAVANLEETGGKSGSMKL
jgi:hypothetical protein